MAPESLSCSHLRSRARWPRPRSNSRRGSRSFRKPGQRRFAGGSRAVSSPRSPWSQGLGSLEETLLECCQPTRGGEGAAQSATAPLEAVRPWLPFPDEGDRVINEGVSFLGAGGLAPRVSAPDAPRSSWGRDLAAVGSCWQPLADGTFLVGSCWQLLAAVGSCWQLLHSWLAAVGSCWQMLPSWLAAVGRAA